MESKLLLKKVFFGSCRLCSKSLDEEEYYLGLGRCRFCARKCEEEVGFGTIYGNVDAGEKFKVIDNSKW